jgi:CHASE2 domain-containing sensor protein
VGTLRVPAPAEVVWLPPSDLPPSRPYDAGVGAEVSGRVVLVGVHWDEDLVRTQDGPRYGVDVLATAVQTVLRQRGLRPASVEASAVLALGGALSTTLLARNLARPSRWLGLFVPAVLVLLALALAAGGVILSFLPALLAVVLAWWACWPGGLTRPYRSG